jgi:hypothetical protein
VSIRRLGGGWEALRLRVLEGWEARRFAYSFWEVAEQQGVKMLKIEKKVFDFSYCATVP